MSINYRDIWKRLSMNNLQCKINIFTLVFMYSGGKISNISFLNVTFMNNLIPFISNKMYNKLFLTEYRDLCISEYTDNHVISRSL